MNVELYRQGVDAWNDRDVERFLITTHPEIEYRSVLMQVDGGAYRGHDGIRRYFADLAETFGDIHAEIEEIQDGGDWVVGTCRLQGTGMASGVPLDWTIVQAARVRDGLFDLIITARSREEALAAAGIE